MTHSPAATDTPENTTHGRCPTDRGRPSIVRAIAAVSGALVLSILATALVATSTEETYPGTLMTRSVTIASPATGNIEPLEFASGEIIIRGRELFLVTDEELEQRTLSAQKRVRELESRLAAAEATAKMRSDELLASVNSEIFDTEMKLVDFLRKHFQHKFEVTAWSDYLDPKDALVSTVTPPINLESAIMGRNRDTAEARIRAIISRANSENEVDSLDAKIGICDRRIKSLQNRTEEIVESVEISLGIGRIRDQLQQATAEFASQREEVAEHLVVSPAYGMTGLIQHRTGDRVHKGDVLLEVFDRDDEFVRVDFPSRLATQLRRGTPVSLIFPGDETREGQIDEVPPQVTSPAQGEETDSRIAVRVIPRGQAWPTLPVVPRGCPFIMEVELEWAWRSMPAK